MPQPTKPELVLIRACQRGTLVNGKRRMVLLAPGNDGRYPSGAINSSWWDNHRLYSPEDLPTKADDIPVRCFLDDRIIGWISEHIRLFPDKARHNNWPGDFGVGGTINAKKYVRHHWGPPALTKDGAIISWQGVHTLRGDLPYPSPGENWVIVNSESSKSSLIGPRLVSGSVSHDKAKAAWYYNLLQIVSDSDLESGSSSESDPENDDSLQPAVGNTNQLDSTNRDGDDSQMAVGNTNQPDSTNRNGDDDNQSRVEIPSTRSRAELEAEVQTLLEANANLRRQSDKNRAMLMHMIDEANHFHRGREAALVLGRESLTTSYDDASWNAAVSSWNDLNNVHETDCTRYENKPNLQLVLFSIGRTGAVLKQKGFIPPGWDLAAEELHHLPEPESETSPSLSSERTIRESSDAEETESFIANRARDLFSPTPSDLSTVEKEREPTSSKRRRPEL
ncbi:hypothetical protein VTL71DRAFT_16116 [Oculimacula yallundae]|uniref:Uncharacterized protein n=1 Tax=Oculimacula yallundae TaxID=86028 RepID=A0ABR4CFW2_9HELO